MKTLIATLSLTAALMSSSAYAQTLPTGGDIAAGVATISAPIDVVTTINQDTTKAVVNWNSFNIGNTDVVFNNPPASATTINHVLSSDALTISGNLNVPDGSILIDGNNLTINSNSPLDLTGVTINTPGNIVINASDLGKTYGIMPELQNTGSTSTSPGGFITATIVHTPVNATIFGTVEVKVIEIPGYTAEEVIALYDAGKLTFDDAGKAIFAPGFEKTATIQPAIFDAATATKHLDVAAMTFAAPAAATSAAELASLSPAAGGDMTPQDRANAYLNHVGLGAN